MFKSLVSLALLLPASGAWAASQQTDFGVRSLSPMAVEAPASSSAAMMLTRPIAGISSAAALAASWGRVTSTYRSPAHNRRVGGVRNSFHLRGRAIDIARRPGVTHSQIAAAFRNAGYQLLESLDEGDHSHFAFAFGGDSMRMASMPTKREMTRWGVVTVSSALLR